MPIELGRLIKKLNPFCRDTLGEAASLCQSHNQSSIELEHWLFKLVERGESDVSRILKQFDISSSETLRKLTGAVGRFGSGDSVNRVPTLSPQIDELVREAWLVGSLQLEQGLVRSGFLLIGLLQNERLKRQILEVLPDWSRIDVVGLQSNFAAITAKSPENSQATSLTTGAAGPSDSLTPGGATPSANSSTPTLDQFATSLTDMAKAGKIDPISGRDSEIRQMVDILIRRRQNNPILTGEPGVGKTAVVEGFARRIAAGDIPDSLKDVDVRALDLGLLQAGAGVRGEFENRLKKLMEEVKASPRPIILFIDEIHTIVGAGGQAGQNDAANLLKPALARGELRTIGATTWSEYKKYFENYAALTRRFQVVKIDEPEIEKAITMMRAIAPILEKHHGVRVLDEAIKASVQLTARYLVDRQLPDKSLSVLDTACARVSLGQSTTPEPLEELIGKRLAIQAEIETLNRDGAEAGRVAELKSDLEALAAREEALRNRWVEEQQLVQKVANLSKTIASGASAPSKTEDNADKPAPDLEALGTELAEYREKLAALQGDSPLARPYADAQAVAEVVAAWTGIPLGKMVTSSIQSIMKLDQVMKARVVGQNHSLDILSERIRTASAGLTDPRRPLGVFMLVGPSGVGKTETALTLADSMYGGEKSLVTINMSEFQESHTVSLLKGSPPGYVGYGEGGILTEAVRRRPYCVVLLDEVEKAHPDVLELFYQVFDKGQLEDGEGRMIDFKNTIILLTSNVATDTITRLCMDPDTRPNADGLLQAIRPELVKAFKPAFVGRTTVVPYFPLDDSVLKSIIALQLGKVTKRFADTHKNQVTFSNEVPTAILGRCKEVESGARNVERIINQTLLPLLATEVLTFMAQGQPVPAMQVGIDANSNFVVAAMQS
jgi:type VI secretion system protein VasG